MVKETSRNQPVIVPFHIPKHMLVESDEAVTFQTASTILTMAALILQNPWFGWLALFSSIASLTNDKALTSTSDKRASWTTIMFSVMGLVLQYLPRVLVPQAKVGGK
ncbi:hypothetical protein K502DRAFT_343686 [Neoconidiobolus thromboides FSU 785]|nr:hypothetical protein K502DRAFT_343686 [Neoconidiobolus thromboides FSU 785]